MASAARTVRVAAAGTAPRVARAQLASGRGGDAALTARKPGNPSRTFCWRAEDSRLLRTSIISFLDQLSVVMRTMQRFGPPLPR
uniref:L antigen family member 3 n=1 Tax=Molossus molossus TaxID=27622 RepID=A0A7J8J7B0_MOLMO|nr:hypothetical protein HJG59_007531 [Molossus molossus]